MRAVTKSAPRTLVERIDSGLMDGAQSVRPKDLLMRGLAAQCAIHAPHSGLHDAGLMPLS
ncbi:hypothetical protein CCR82_00410 [Halochromatium salexigens]|uniref:Uncharacterized protein n=1 Tax=Halochromatium salexigens TaxID=49447 RepID=A0AAJ0XER8_HALSE|nr:hypothetical protein [Halochromatium salexigens]